VYIWSLATGALEPRNHEDLHSVLSNSVIINYNSISLFLTNYENPECSLRLFESNIPVCRQLGRPSRSRNRQDLCSVHSYIVIMSYNGVSLHFPVRIIMRNTDLRLSEDDVSVCTVRWLTLWVSQSPTFVFRMFSYIYNDPKVVDLQSLVLMVVRNTHFRLLMAMSVYCTKRP
jgi:hypothetical protein